MPKSIGIIRQIDDLGRIVISKTLRKKFGIMPKDAIEIYTENSLIIFKKYESHCIFCNNTNELTKYKEKLICKKCLKEIKR